MTRPRKLHVPGKMIITPPKPVAPVQLPAIPLPACVAPRRRFIKWALSICAILSFISIVITCTRFNYGEGLWDIPMLCFHIAPAFVVLLPPTRTQRGSFLQLLWLVFPLLITLTACCLCWGNQPDSEDIFLLAITFPGLLGVMLIFLPACILHHAAGDTFQPQQKHISILHKILIFCTVATLAALITCSIRHSVPSVILVSFFALGLIPPFLLLAMPTKRNRLATIIQHVLLFIPIGIALGSWLMALAPTGNPDGELMGWTLLTVCWSTSLTPVCIIPLLFKNEPQPPTVNPLSFRKATPFDQPALRHLYNEVIDAMDGASSHAQWRRGGYPTDAFLQTKAAVGELWVAEKNGKIVAAMVLNAECNPGYSQASWQVDCEPHEVMAIHTLGVSPSVQGQGVGKAMVQQAIAIARQQGCKSMRLDVIDTNPAAGEFYAHLGFTNHGRYLLDYPGAVCTYFDLYELGMGNL